MGYFTQTNLENAVGGADVLVQLLDKSGSGVADPNLVTDIINRATSVASSAIQVSTDLTGLVSPYPDALIFHTTNIGAYYAYLQGTQGMGIPQHIRDLYDESLRWLDQVANRTRTLGIAAKPATDQDVKQIDTNPLGDQVTRTSLVGLW